MVNDVASYGDRAPGQLEIYFSQVGFVYDKGSMLSLPKRIVMRAIRKDEHAYALLNVLENGNAQQDMFNPEMKQLALDYVQKKGLTW